jgi:hypothetical protein
MSLVARAVALLALVAPGAAAEPTTGAPITLPARGPTARNGYESLREGWSSFADHFLLLDMMLVLLLALALGAIIAYHPSIRRQAYNLEQFEQPKALLMYAVVAAVVALIVQVQPAMAFVIFGIGGLLRFRTDVGDAKDTGRVILVTVLGLCCGLKIYIVALPAALIGWLLIFVLEQQSTGIIRVSGVGEDGMHEATRAHRALIAAAGCKIIGEQTKFVKREFLFVVKPPPTLDRAKLQAAFDALAPGVRGVVDWERL